MKLRSIVAISLFILIPLSVAADFSLSAWPFVKPITGLPILGSPEYIVVPIDTELESNIASSRFDDLRIITDKGDEVASMVIADGPGQTVVLYPVTITERREEVAHSSTVLVASFDGAGPVLESLELIPLSSGNFFRRLVVDISADGKFWVPVAERTVSQVDVDGSIERSLVVTFPANRAKFVRVTIFNDDNRAVLFAPEIRFVLPHRAILFAAYPGEAYAAYFGNSLASRPSYDLVRIAPKLRTDLLQRASLGPIEKNPDFISERTFAKLDANETTLNVLFLSLTVLLFLALVFVLRNMIRGKADRRE